MFDSAASMRRLLQAGLSAEVGLKKTTRTRKHEMAKSIESSGRSTDKGKRG